MLSLMNVVDLCLLRLLCVLYEMQNQVFQQLHSYITFLSNGSLLTDVKEVEKVRRTSPHYWLRTKSSIGVHLEVLIHYVSIRAKSLNS